MRFWPSNRPWAIYGAIRPTLLKYPLFYALLPANLNSPQSAFTVIRARPPCLPGGWTVDSPIRAPPELMEMLLSSDAAATTKYLPNWYVDCVCVCVCMYEREILNDLQNPSKYLSNCHLIAEFQF